MNSYAHEREELLRSIAHDQQDLQDALDELKRAANHAVDVASAIAEHPVPWLVGAFLFGFLLGVRRRFAAEAG